VPRSARWSCILLAGACACLKAPGADFETRYGKGCEQQALPAGAVREGEAFRALVARVDGAGPELRRCYTDALAYAPRMQGRVLLRLAIGAAGVAPQVEVAENTTRYAAFGCCVAAVVRQAASPLKAAGTQVVLEYPLTFKLVSMPVGYRYDVGPDFAYASARPEGFELALDNKMYGGAP